MNVSVVLAHPSKDSLNHAIANIVDETLRANGHAVSLHDLYAEGFDPVLPVEELLKGAKLDPVVRGHCDEIVAADGIIIIHPNWWGQPPAILKGWIDRVIRPGIAYEFEEGDDGEGVPVGLLKAHNVIVFNTSNTPAQRELEAFGDPLETLWKNCIFSLCGVSGFHRKMYSVVVTSTLGERQTWLDDVRVTINRFYP